MNEIAGLSESMQHPNMLQDCFKSACFEELHIAVYGAAAWNRQKPVWIRIRFRCGETSGEQKMEADTLMEAFEKITSFQKEIEKREEIFKKENEKETSQK